MISVQEAQRIIFEHIIDFGTTEVPTHEALGRILREDLYADRDFPPFDRVAMDGIAIRYSDFKGGARQFAVSGVVAAGQPPISLEASGTCLEVMTGAMLPPGTDTVVPYEHIAIVDGVAVVQDFEVLPRQNIHRRAIDRAQGALLTRSPFRLSGAEIGVAATIGKTQLLVSRQPRVALISTGDELVEIDQQPLPHQIRRSNVYRIGTTLAAEGVLADTFHLADDLEEVTRRLGELLVQYDVLILSGGVSMGKFDYLPQALDALGVERLFHKVAQRPGKPIWFGMAEKEKTVVFALPGNPVSSFVCTHAYVLPWLQACTQQPHKPQLKAALATDFQFKPALDYFLQVRLFQDEAAKWWAEPIPGNGSGDLANLLDVDGFLQLPAHRNDFERGEVFPVWVFRG